jgi:hypothetical protein
LLVSCFLCAFAIRKTRDNAPLIYTDNPQRSKLQRPNGFGRGPASGRMARCGREGAMWGLWR